MKTCLLIILVCSSSCLAVHAQEKEPMSIGGMVVNAEDHLPIIGANVTISGTVLGTVTDANGKFVIRRAPSGNQTLVVSIIGFRRKEVRYSTADSNHERIRIELEPMAIQTEPVVVTASKREESLEEVPASVSVIDSRALEYRNTVTVDDALKYVPGVNITRGQVNLRGSTGFSYGVGTRVLILIDGLPFITGDTGEIIWESIPPDQIERIEVVKGAGSALYGSSALGGVINIITKQATEQPDTRIRTYGGMYDQPKYASWQWTTSARTLGGLSLSHAERFENLSLVIGGSRTEDDGYKENDFWKRWNGWARVGYDISPFQSVSVSFSILDQYRGNFLYWVDLDSALIPQPSHLNDRIQSTRWNLSARHKYFVTADFYLTTSVSWFHTHWDDNLPTPTDSLGSSSKSDFITSEIQLNFQPDQSQFITAGISGTYNDVFAETIFGDHLGHAGAAYLQDEVKLAEQIRLTVGGRYDIQTISGLQTANQFNPKLGIGYTPVAGTSLRASVGRGFRSPSIAEIYTNTEAGGVIISPNPNLQPERSWSYEVGGSHSFSDALLIDCSLFRNELWDMIEPSFGETGTVQFQNVTRARITGIELSGSYNLARRWFTDLGYTYVSPLDVETGDILKYRPRILFYASSRILIEPFQFGIDYRHISEMERIDQEFVQFGIVPDGDQRIPVSVCDVRVRVDWDLAGIGMATSLQVNNLFQYYYTDFIGNLGPLRSFVLTLEARP